MSLEIRIGLGVLIVALGLGLAPWWLRGAKRRWEARMTLDALAGMHWRDGLNLLLQALSTEGYQASANSVNGAGDGLSRLLSRVGGPTLLVYKPATAYALDATSVAELSSAMLQAGASHGILATLGSITPAARRAAEGTSIQLRGGDELAQALGPLLPQAFHDTLRKTIDHRLVRTRMSAFGASIVLGVAAVITAPQPGTEDTTVQPDIPPQGSRVARGVARMPAAPPVTPIDGGLPPAAQRTALARHLKRDMAGIRSAAWGSPSTLEISVDPDIDLDALLPEICQAMGNYEALSGSRLQFNGPTPGEPARWRSCP